MTLLTEETLREAGARWQKILRLQDWDIHWQIKRERDMKALDSWGETEVHDAHKRAAITLQDPVDYEDGATDRPDGYDWETTVVHELLHVYFRVPEQQLRGLATDAMHQALGQLAYSLVNLYNVSRDHGT